MIISFNTIKKEYNLNIRGVLHIGAHFGEEVDLYIKNGIENIYLFEPVRSNFFELQKKIQSSDKIKLFNFALGNDNTTKQIYVETDNRGQSCSLLEPKTHLELYPFIKFPNRELVVVRKLDDIGFDRTLFNMINIDVQGYELEVFKGGEKTLEYMDYIYTEVNLEEIYKDCVLLDDLDMYLNDMGFMRVLLEQPMKSKSEKYPWGDALYIRNGLI